MDYCQMFVSAYTVALAAFGFFLIYTVIKSYYGVIGRFLTGLAVIAIAALVWYFSPYRGVL